MKKIYLSVLSLITAGSIYSQAFWTPTSYKGAFPVTDGQTGINSNDWTAGWCNWDPQNVNYPNTNITVSSDITTNTTWASGSVVLLQNKVYVTNGATLTIEPGVIIRGDQATGATLIISRGSKINAQGTLTNPIVFTSNQASGSRNLGDWGGVVILGNARNNQPGGVAVIEGGLDPIKAEFGGTDDNDNSGVFSFVRIEFAGIPFQVDKEINGLTMGSVGSATKIDHVQCSFINDDAFEWFGGTVNAKYLVAFRSLDDDFDTDFGYRGNVQFGLIVRDPNIADQSASSTSEGFESDNDATGTNATPYTAPVFSNITLIGPYRGSTGNAIDPKFRRALRLRRNTYTSVFNSIFTDFPTGLHIDGSAAIANALTDSLRFENNLLAGMGAGKNLDASSPTTIRNWFNTNNNDTLVSTSGLFVNPYDFTNGDYRLAINSLAINTTPDFLDSFIGLTSNCNTIIGINEISDNISFNFNLYPNPAQNVTNIEVFMIENNQIDIEILDLTGKIVYSKLNIESTNNNLIEINTDELINGMYFVKLSTGVKTITKKLIINK